jgi:hypothetical protein
MKSHIVPEVTKVYTKGGLNCVPLKNLLNERHTMLVKEIRAAEFQDQFKNDLEKQI